MEYVRSENNISESVSYRRNLESGYQKWLNVLFVAISLPAYLFFAHFFYFSRSNPFQARIFLFLSIVSLVTLFLVLWLKEQKHLALLKWIGSTTIFAFLGASLISGLCGDDIYIFLPWICSYPISLMFIFGKRVGPICSLVFYAAAAWIILGRDLPPWTEATITLFKYNFLAALFFILITAFISELIRLWMRNKLLNARNKYKIAEQVQRETNTELQREIALRIQSENALAESETRYRTLFQESSVSLWEEDFSGLKACIDQLALDPTEDLENYFKNHPGDLETCIKAVRVVAVNQATLNLYEADSTEDLLNKIRRILPSNVPDFIEKRLTALYRTGHYDAKVTAQTINGRVLHLLVNSKIQAGYEKSWKKVYTSVYDNTRQVQMEEEKKRIDEQLQRSRRIQALASLAGGIAHQFNNGLAIIHGSLDLLELDLQPDSKHFRFIDTMRNSATKLNLLTEQLLSYARGGKYQPKSFSVNLLIEEQIATNKCMRNKSVKITTKFDPEICLCNGDITQINIVLGAVLTNAVEALKETGEVMIATRRLRIANGASSKLNLAPGVYAEIMVEDNGIGMDEPTLQQVFDPFFTTKFVGRGLGMAAAYGIVKNHDGRITVDSVLHQGTRVSIYLPAVNDSNAVS
ncbi:MAG: ATP-binding protein [Desulfobacteraceae bacterium]|nr:ATP-binding protein [Desulfobacteraceae bacterium]